MKINIAGAGAGKTTGLANEIISKYNDIPKNKNIYCVAFTNGAVDSIKEKLHLYFGIMPQNIIVGTIHSFLYQEFISPYYYLIFDKHYKSMSNIQLPIEPKYKNKKLAELDAKDILHIQRIPERAKWVVLKKSSDKQKEKNARNCIINTFLKYCGIIYVDEAQDIDANMKDVFSTLSNAGAEMVFFGDPKQDIRGYNSFRELINDNTDNVTYDSTCHRCPKEHLKLTNSLIRIEEQQVSQKSGGTIEIIFEKDICLDEFMKRDFDLKYIYRKNDKFDTHSLASNSVNIDDLYYEIHSVLSEISAEDINTEINAYGFAQQINQRYTSGQTPQQAIKPFCDLYGGITKVQYAKLCNTLPAHVSPNNQSFSISSIESIKGLEGSNCLFVLTTDLSAYLFGKKTTENKTKNALYVALTRSLNKLTFLICKEVEDEYGRIKIDEFFSHFK
ncbi:MAG: AAA family ATPase [Clostridia bacterium]|nr:AAA family ATPase [Clostridia bacterium]